MRLLSWNLFHGRDFPPNQALFTARSKFLRVTEHDDTHVQVNRPLRREFAQVLGAARWDVALLQEAPPRWHRVLAQELGAETACTLTSRNSLGWLRGRLAELNPDLIGSNEGGSNQVLVRPPWRIEETREHTLAERPERRRMCWTRLTGPGGVEVVVANLHGSVDTVTEGPQQVVDSAAVAVDWAGGVPLVFGGDLNLRVTRHADAFAELAERFGLAAPTARTAIDHLLVRGLDVIDPPRLASPEARELPAGDGRAIRLSDHAYVTCVVGMR